MKTVKFKLKDGSMTEEVKGVNMLESSDLYPAFPANLYPSDATAASAADADSSAGIDSSVGANSTASGAASVLSDHKSGSASCAKEGAQLSDKIKARSFASLQLRAKNAMKSLFSLKRERMLVLCTGRMVDPVATAYDMVKEVTGIEPVIAYAPTKFELFGNDKEDGILTANYCALAGQQGVASNSTRITGSNATRLPGRTRLTSVASDGLFTTDAVNATAPADDAANQAAAATAASAANAGTHGDDSVPKTKLTTVCTEGLFTVDAVTAASPSSDDEATAANDAAAALAGAAASAADTGSSRAPGFNVVIMPCVHLIDHAKWLGMVDACLAQNDSLKLILVGDATDVAQLSMMWPTLENAISTDVVLEFPVIGALHTLGGLINYYRANDRDGEDLLPFSRDALALLAAYSCRISGDRRYIGLTELSLKSIIYEANRFALRHLRDISRKCIGKPVVQGGDVAAEVQQEAYVSRYHVLKALGAIDFRNNFLAESGLREHRDRQLLIATQGAVVGQINGLSVIETLGTSYEYGEPVRITATLRAGGEGDVIDIERKAELAGQIHAKAMMIINGFLTKEFGSEQPLPVSASLVFEQSYSEVDGDSASLTGLCAVISVLAGIPIRQDLAVTGAVDQFGDVQAVGGVNEKIEGFYRVCRLHGLTGTQGVIIPSSCVNQLVLRPAVVKAVAEGKFHIFTVSHVTEAVKMLTTVDWGNSETENTVCYRICERLNNVIAGAHEPTWWEDLTEKIKDGFAKLTGKSADDEDAKDSSKK